RGRRVMQRAEYYATKLALEVMPGFVDTGRGKLKRPCGPWALVTREIPEILAFGGAWNGGLIFAPMGHDLVDLDVDVKNGKQGDEDLTALEIRFGPLPKTPRWQTPSGGRHILFRSGSHRIPKSIATLGKRPGEETSGLDVLGVGTLTVLPGSERPDGVVEWEPDLSPDDIDIAIVPDWLAGLMLKAAGDYPRSRPRSKRAK